MPGKQPFDAFVAHCFQMSSTPLACINLSRVVGYLDSIVLSVFVLNRNARITGSRGEQPESFGLD